MTRRTLAAAGLASLVLAGCGARDRAEPPNVLLIVVDTLRFDRLAAYGHDRDTSPRIDEWLARPGTVVERAYAQAPWTLPSTASLLTGRLPGELAGEAPDLYEIPSAVPALAERLAALGYRTAGFIANPILHRDNGFARGFGDFYTPPMSWKVLEWVDARTINERAVPWLEAGRGSEEPFFLYLHYIDPHDPYQNPDLTAGNGTRWDPGYAGRVRGDWAQDLYAGKRALPDPEADLHHLLALYDSEIRYVDRHVGELLESIPPEVLRDTLVVLTSDHGEEFLDHGGWKHGQTLYEEMLRVPLILRWDGVIPRGGRLAGPVALLDLVPTILSAVGAPAEEHPGRDLLPALTEDKPLAPRPVFAEHLAHGPMRGAVIHHATKLILFNEEEPADSDNPLHKHLRRLDRSRLERIELYDLEVDPGERESRAAGRSADVARLSRLLMRRAAFEERGLRVVAEGLAPGVVLEVRITLDRPVAAWLPWFLGPSDRVEVEGREIVATLVAEAIPKGVVLRGDDGRIERCEAALLAGEGAPAVRIADVGELPRGGVAVTAVGSRPPAADGPAVLVWRRELRETAGDAGDATERLRALGYLGWISPLRSPAGRPFPLRR